MVLHFPGLKKENKIPLSQS
uniref:Uncharacterized protein n=1 Tax=Anguilla anguilla TaxID=7936 RepID=A0A0E9THA5_ANGAN